MAVKASSLEQLKFVKTRVLHEIVCALRGGEKPIWILQKSILLFFNEETKRDCKSFFIKFDSELHLDIGPKSECLIKSNVNKQ